MYINEWKINKKIIFKFRISLAKNKLKNCFAY